MNKTIRRSLAATAALTLGTGFALGTASAAHAVDICVITSLTLDNPIVVETGNSSAAGDDGGFLSVTQSHLLVDGDSNIYAYDLVSLSPVAAGDADETDNFVYASDLKTNTAYQVVSRGDITQLVALDDDGNTTATLVTLSETIPEDPQSDNDFLISGFGWIGIWEIDVLGSLKVIDPSSGLVTTLQTNLDNDYSPQPFTNSEGVGDFDGGGVGMFDGTDYWYVGSDANGDISKFNITGNALSSVMLENNMEDSPDSDTFMVSVTESRFYIHDEGPGSFWFDQDTTNISEPVLSADATFSGPCGDAPAPAPVLPDTGVDAATTTAVSAGLAVLGALAIILIRRRRANVG